VSEEAERARRHYGGREIDPIEAASIHIHLQELRDHIDSYLEIEIDDEDSADRIEADCRADHYSYCRPQTETAYEVGPSRTVDTVRIVPYSRQS